MKKIFNFVKKRIKEISFLSIILLIIFVNMSSVFAGYMDQTTSGNKKEQQLFEKIELIHSIFPNQTDEDALYATLVHRGTLTDYIEESYDPDFDADEYKDTWSQLQSDIANAINNIGDSIISVADFASAGFECFGESFSPDMSEKSVSDDEKNCVLNKVIEKYANRVTENSNQSKTLIKNIKTPDSVDLLFAATIVMIDSSGWTGTYSDENYKKALAGDGLVGNMFDKNDMLGNLASIVMNTFFCTVGTITDTVLNFSPGFTFDDNGFGVEKNAMAGKLSRYYTMANICQNGFIGGTYDHVKNPDLSTEEGKEQYQGKKDIVAEQIVGLAERFRQMSASEGDLCEYGGNTQASIFMNMTTEEYINTMGPIAQADYSRTGIFASVTLAQSIIESGWGKSGLTQKANNMFGIKCSSNWSGECINMDTGEYGSGGYYVINSAFRKYDSIEASVSDHSLFFKENSRYGDAGVLTATDYATQIRAIHQAGYATAPDYSSTIIDTIKTYGLDKWDVKTNTTTSNVICAPYGNNGWTIRTVAPTSSDQAFVMADSGNVGQCVWYAKGRAIEIVQELNSKGKLTDDEANKIIDLLSKGYGNGGDIYDNAKSVFNSSNDIRKPKAGSYIVWKQPGSWGHVAIVEDVTDTTITITEGWSSGGGSLSCSSDWSCVHFEGPNTYQLEDFYNNFGAHYYGGYNFSGYVYFLEPLN